MKEKNCGVVARVSLAAAASCGVRLAYVLPGFIRSVLVVSLAVVISGLSGCGCGGEGAADGAAQSAGDGGAKVQKKKRSLFRVDDLAPETVIMTINGQPILQSDYARWYRLRDRMYRIANKIPADVKNDKTAAFERDSRLRVPAELIRRELFRQEAERLGVSVPPEALAKAQRKFMRTLQRGKEPFSKIAEIFGPEDAEGVRETVYRDVRDEFTVIASSTNNLRKISDAELDARLADIAAWNARADATNVVQRARAVQARADILNGGNFAAIASNRSDRAKQEGAQWLILDITEAMDESEELGAWLAKSSPGDISPPIELDDGLSIVGVVNKFEDPDAEAGEIAAMQYQVVRCVFDVYEREEEPESREELAKAMLAERMTEATRTLAMRLAQSSNVDFPQGEKIFAPRKPKKAPLAKAGAGQGGARQRKAAAKGKPRKASKDDKAGKPAAAKQGAEPAAAKEKKQ